MAEFRWFRGNEVRYNSKADAEQALDNLLDISERYSYVSIADFLDLSGLVSNFDDQNYGWPEWRIHTAKIKGNMRDGYYIDLGYPFTSDQLEKIEVSKGYEPGTGNISFSKVDPKIYPVEKIDIDAVMKTVNDFKEDKNMGTRYNYNTTCNPSKGSDIPRVSSLEFEDPIEVEFEKKKKDLLDEAEKKILDIRQELAIALNKIEEERYERRQQEKEKSMAKAWKRKYDALVEAGFTEDQAWMMTMESFKLD